MSILQIGCWTLAVILAPCLVGVLIKLVPELAKVSLQILRDKETGLLERYTMAGLGVMGIPCMAVISLLLYSKLILTALNK